MFILCSHSVHAQRKTMLEVRVSGFIPFSQLFSEIYGNDVVPIAVEATTPFFRHFDAWANFNWLSKHGHSIGLQNPTDVSIANFSFGLKFPFLFYNGVAVYVGLGPSLGGVWLHNRSKICHCDQRIREFIYGGVLKTGINFFINRSIFFDLFVDYFYVPTNFQTRANVGGIQPGIGSGFIF